jgi:hypothetical protein
MGYQVNVMEYTHTHVGVYTRVFDNFISYEKAKDPLGLGHPWTIALAPYNAKNIQQSPYIEFETEQDYLLFALKFG